MIHEPRSVSGAEAGYEIRVQGELGAGWSDWFAGLVVAGRDGGETVMAGSLDQAGLHAVLRRVRDLGLPLISVRRVEPDHTTSNDWVASPEDEA